MFFFWMKNLLFLGKFVSRNSRTNFFHVYILVRRHSTPSLCGLLSFLTRFSFFAAVYFHTHFFLSHEVSTRSIIAHLYICCWYPHEICVKNNSFCRRYLPLRYIVEHTSTVDVSKSFFLFLGKKLRTFLPSSHLVGFFRQLCQCKYTQRKERQWFDRKLCHMHIIIIEYTSTLL